MNTLIVLVLILFGIFFSLGFVNGAAPVPAHSIEAEATAEATPAATPAASPCPTRSTQQDVDDAIAFGRNLFNPPAWTVTITNDIHHSDTVVEWTSDTYYSAIHMDFFHYDCGLTVRDMKQLLKSLDFQIVFTYYRSYKQVAQCNVGNTYLYEFDVVTTNGSPYYARYWIKPVSVTRVVALNLVFPQSEQAKLASYAQRLFPELPTCSPLESNQPKSDAIWEER